MNDQYTLVATFTYPHEALFIESAMAACGINYRTALHDAKLHNSYYAVDPQIKNVFVKNTDLSRALKILRKIQPDSHAQNRCTIIHTKDLEGIVESSKGEKQMCWYCYGVMAMALGYVLYAIIHSIHFLF